MDCRRHNRGMDRVSFDGLARADLTIDAVYEAGPERNVRADPLQRLLPVGNQGGFRYCGPRPSPRLVVLYTTGSVSEWPDELDEITGVVNYYGDNRHAGRRLHETPRGGNLILSHTFAAMRGSAQDRAGLPVFLMFESVGSTRDVRFRGLIVPGTSFLEADEELVGIWRSENGQRFQNYRAKFTVLDVAHISRAWIDDVLAGNPLSALAPEPWRRWVATRTYRALEAPTITPVRTREQQLPAVDDRAGWQLLNDLYATFQPNPVGFERIAVNIAQLAVPLPLRMDVTRPSSDGGRDAVGGLAIGGPTDPVWISLALEAKCYEPGRTSAGVRDVSRLVSRLKHRDLGLFVTTSFLARQAYHGDPRGPTPRGRPGRRGHRHGTQTEGHPSPRRPPCVASSRVTHLPRVRNRNR